MNEIISLSVGDRRQHTALLVMFGGLAMLIAALGLYGLLAQTVSARGREIGIRMALGATWKSVMAMVMSRGMALTATGLVGRSGDRVVGHAGDVGAAVRRGRWRSR